LSKGQIICVEAQVTSLYKVTYKKFWAAFYSLAHQLQSHIAEVAKEEATRENLWENEMKLDKVR